MPLLPKTPGAGGVDDQQHAPLEGRQCHGLAVDAKGFKVIQARGDSISVVGPGRDRPEQRRQQNQRAAHQGAAVPLGNLPRQPRCTDCPMRGLCVAERQGQTELYPVKSRKLKRSSQRLWLLWAERSDGSVWLERRPEQGIWGGLQCLPVFESLDQLSAAVPARARESVQELPGFLHVLTHRDLHLHPVRVPWNLRSSRGLPVGQWWAHKELAGLGLPAPVRKLLGA
jgi:adenine-specific DNA glycosylase